MDDLSQRLNAVQLKQERNFAFLRGVVVAGGFLFASLQWYAVHQFDQLDTALKNIVSLDHRLEYLEDSARCPLPPVRAIK